MQRSPTFYVALRLRGCHETAAIRVQDLLVVGRSPADHRGAIMKMLTSAELFAPPKRTRKTQDWFERAKLVVAAARDCARETAQQRAAPSMTCPSTMLQSRRLAERLSAKSSPGRRGRSRVREGRQA
jgi:hypothetical protein